MAERPKKRNLVESYKPGQFICRDGEFGREMFIIQSGKVDVVKQVGDGEMLLATLGKNDFFGEMALFGQNKRTASVKAKLKTDIIVVTQKMLFTQFAKIPDWLVKIIKTIARRIISTSKGVVVKHKISLEFSILKTVSMVFKLKGNPTMNGFTIPMGVLRNSLMYTLGVPFDDIDTWIKRFGLVNLVKVVTGGMVEVPDIARLDLFIEYMLMKAKPNLKVTLQLDRNTTFAFQRMNKLLSR